MIHFLVWHACVFTKTITITIAVTITIIITVILVLLSQVYQYIEFVVEYMGREETSA